MIRVFFYLVYCVNDCMINCVCVDYVKCKNRKIVILSVSKDDMGVLMYLCFFFLCIIVYSVGMI